MVDVHVTNLNDSGAGSLREALSGGNRRIVFDVAGTIHLDDFLYVRNTANYTIAGETAPSPGITLLGYPIWNIDSHNYIIRNIRHRGQDGIFLDQGGGCFNNTRCYDVVYQNCSMTAWCYGSEGITFWNTNHDVTVMDCISGGGNPLAEGGQPAGTHDYPLATGFHQSRITFLRNLMYRPTYRAPSLGYYDGQNGDFLRPPAGEVTGEVINNLIWDFGGHTPGGHDSAYGTTIYYAANANVINNYYYSAFWAGTNRAITGATYDANAYCSGNYSKNGDAAGLVGNVGTPFTVNPPEARITPMSATDAAAYVVAHAGCRVGGLDSIDQGWINQINSVGL